MPGPFRFHKFSRDKFPDWRCPACLNETLVLIPESFIEKQSLQTGKISGEDWFEPYMYEGIFSCMLQCSRRDCRESVALIGESGYEEEWDDQMRARTYECVLAAKAFLPPLPLFTATEKCPTTRPFFCGC